MADEALAGEKERSDHVIEMLIHTTFIRGYTGDTVLADLIGAVRKQFPNLGVTVTNTDFGTHIWFGNPDLSTLLKEEATDPDPYPEDPREEFTWVRDSQL